MTASFAPRCSRIRARSALNSDGSGRKLEPFDAFSSREPVSTLLENVLVSIDPDNPAFFDRERQLAVFQRQRRLAEQLAAPAVQRADVGIVIGRDLFEIVDGCD